MTAPSSEPSAGSEPPESAGLPMMRGSVRFAVGSPEGLTSNSWKMWTTAGGDVYVACRDNARECKASLHASGRWRYGLTEKAVSDRPSIVQPGQDRAWAVWDRPKPDANGIIRALDLVFINSELAVTPELRDQHPSLWRKGIYLEAPADRLVGIATVFITHGAPRLLPSAGPSIWLAALPLPDGKSAQLVYHTEPLDPWRPGLNAAIQQIHQVAGEKDVPIAVVAYWYGSEFG